MPTEDSPAESVAALESEPKRMELAPVGDAEDYHDETAAAWRKKRREARRSVV